MYEDDDIKEENLSQDRRINLVGLNSHKPEAATESAVQIQMFLKTLKEITCVGFSFKYTYIFYVILCNILYK